MGNAQPGWTWWLLAIGIAGCGRVPDHADPALHGTACYACHGDLYLAAERPDHVAAELSRQCETCHTTTGWQTEEVGDHRFWPLTGAHASATCEGCHAGGRFDATPTTCVGCHEEDYVRTTEPDHEARQLGTTCQSCHTTVAWAPATFDHAAVWPLVGAHAETGCESCHEGGRYAGTPDDCAGCHFEDWQRSSDPNHASAGIGTRCEACHTASAWRPAELTSHDRFWPLAGAHADVSCAGCHADGRFTGTPRACEGCHLDDYEATTAPDHAAAELPTACGACHREAAWRPARLDAHDRFWPLAGRHLAAACEDCHEGGVFAGTPRECEGCHMAEFEATENPDHAALELETACGGCHTESAWWPADFTAHDRFWPILGKHAELDCESCHAGQVFGGTARECEGCHRDAFVATTRPDHEALALSDACAGCHDESGWQPAGFDVHDRFWPIEGKHGEVSCEGCHAGGVFEGTERTCEGCHLEAYEDTTEPPHAAAGFPKTCETCHDALGWKPSTFDHEAVWPLVGEHATAGCEACHEDGVYEGTARACEGCHLADYEGTVDPNHAELGLPKECGGCHTATGWSPANLTAHDQFWPLAGAHATATCEACHGGGVFAGTPRLCEGCHQDDYQATTQPAHAAAGYPETCETCHGVTAWRPSRFDHAASWPLTGKHATATCLSCHADGVYEGTPRTCEGCHHDDFLATSDPPHAALGYPTTCETCHATTGWSSAFDHARIFALVGAHAGASCDGCHGNGVFDGTPRTCAGCHLADYQATTRPDHDGSGIGTLCETCHTATAWTPATLDHTRFWPLTGAHKTATCEGCHGGGVFDGTPRTCQGCHLPDYQASTRPAHASEGYPKTCESCHGTAAWAPSTFDHGRYWPLSGEHLGATCVACHAGEVFAGTATTCAGCHLPEYQATTTPAHASAGFSTVCEGCHATTGWVPATFDHALFWPLTGRHASVTCESCHAGGYAGTPTTCGGCHLPDYQATTAPAHAASGFSTACQTCHGTSAWVPSTFDHGTFWPLTGQHRSATCESCHAGGVFAGTPRACEGCHLPEYNATTTPDHAASGFPTSCEACHATTGWTPATFDHGVFWPLTGQHQSATCESCHVGGVYAGTPRACEGCHLPEYNTTTTPDHAASGFPTSCEACHATTGWTPATFDHSVFWPLTGQHQSATCESCHVGGVYAGTPTSCYACHQSDYTGSTNPSHTALGISTTCQTCHTTAGWDTNTFPGHDTLFPITSGDHKVFGCQDCHKTASWNVFTCTGCHTGEHNLTEMNDKHREEPDYLPTLSTYGVEGGCLHCHPTGRSGD